jgi:hypothetical protein
MRKIVYRSRGLSAGALNKMGTAHVHIDGANSQELVLGIVKQLARRGNLGKMNYVVDFVAGPQRLAEKETYAAHTPGAVEEELDFFSSTLVHDRRDAIAVINSIARSLRDTRGVIIELEQVAGWADRGCWQDEISPEQKMEPIRQGETLLAPKSSLPFEIHHGFDVKKSKSKPMVSLPKLLRFCRRHDMSVGGWFVFDKGTHWAYRSNAFCRERGLIGLVEKQNQLLNEFLGEVGADASVRTLVERTLGIFHTQG